MTIVHFISFLFVLFLTINHIISLPTTSIVTNNVSWSSLLSRHNPYYTFTFNPSTSSWDTLPTNWLTGPFTGNGLIGATLYFCDPPSFSPVSGQGRGGYCQIGNATHNAELRIELGRQDLYSARQPLAHFWNGVRLPVGYLRIPMHGLLLTGTMMIDLYNAEIIGNLTTDKGTLMFRFFTHATEPVHILEVNSTGQEQPILLPVFVPLTQCVNRIDVQGLINCTLYPNPIAICKPGNNQGETVCLQPMDTTDQGSFATAIKSVSSTSSNIGYVTYITTASAMWPYNISTDPSILALETVQMAAATGVASLTISHRSWWYDIFWTRSMLSIPDTKVESFYYIELYKMGSNMRENGPIRDEIGSFYVDTEWPTLWLDLNLELTYWPVAASNRYEGGRTLGAGLLTNIVNGHLLANAHNAWPQLRNWTDVANIGASSNQMAVPGDLGDLAWITHDVFLQCQYEYNATCFLSHLLPPLRGVIGSYRHILAYNLNGTPTTDLHLFPTDSPAGYPAAAGWDCSYDISGIRWAFATYLDVCNAAIEGTGVFANLQNEDISYNVHDPPPECDPDGMQDAQRIIRDITPLSIDPIRGINVWGYRDGSPVPFTLPFRHFSHLLAFVDYLIIAPDDSSDAFTICANTLDNFYNVTWTGHAASTFSIAGVAQMNAYLGRGNAAYGNVTSLLFEAGTIGPSTFDNEGSSATGEGSDVVNITPEATAATSDVLQKIMLQSHHDILRIFTALPDTFGYGNNSIIDDETNDAVFWRLRGERGFLVSAKASNGTTDWVQIESEAGAQPVLLNVQFTNTSASNDIKFLTYPSNAGVVITPVGTTGVRQLYNITGLNAGETVLIWPSSSGSDGTFAVNFIPTRGNCANQYGWHPGYISGPCNN